MKSFLAAVVAVFLLPVFSQATDFAVPTQTITGAESTVALGEIINLELTAPQNAPPEMASWSARWLVIDGGQVKHVREIDNGVFFGAGIQAKTITATAAVTYLYISKDGMGVVKEVATKTILLTTSVVIGGPTPTPGPNPGPTPTPGPNPGPTPGPTFPAGRFGLSRTVYDIALKNVKDAPSRAKGAAALASSFRQIEASIRAGKFTKLQDALKATKTSNDNSLVGAGPAASWVGFGADLQEVLDALNKGAKLNTLGDLADAWEELATGLDNIR